jgi:mediator of RNA polymerase II transcription subunit 7
MLISANQQYAEKIQDLGTLFYNFHHLLNEYRPHQARESLILMMQDQLERSKAETEGILRMKAEVETVLAGLGKLGFSEKEGSGEAPGAGPGNGEVEDGRDVWDELERGFS